MLLQSLTNITFFIMTPEAERFNGWAAMLGFVAAVGAYVTTGQIIPGWFQILNLIFFQIGKFTKFTSVLQNFLKRYTNLKVKK